MRIGPNVKIPSKINLPLKTFLIIGDTRMAKMRKYWKKYGIKIPSDKLIKEKEEELMLEIDEQKPEGTYIVFRQSTDVGILMHKRANFVSCFCL